MSFGFKYETVASENEIWFVVVCLVLLYFSVSVVGRWWSGDGVLVVGFWLRASGEIVGCSFVVGVRT